MQAAIEHACKVLYAHDTPADHRQEANEYLMNLSLRVEVSPDSFMHLVSLLRSDDVNVAFFCATVLLEKVRSQTTPTGLLQLVKESLRGHNVLDLKLVEVIAAICVGSDIEAGIGFIQGEWSLGVEVCLAMATEADRCLKSIDCSRIVEFLINCIGRGRDVRVFQALELYAKLFGARVPNNIIPALVKSLGEGSGGLLEVVSWNAIEPYFPHIVSRFKEALATEDHEFCREVMNFLVFIVEEDDAIVGNIPALEVAMLATGSKLIYIAELALDFWLGYQLVCDEHDNPSLIHLYSNLLEVLVLRIRIIDDYDAIEELRQLAVEEFVHIYHIIGNHFLEKLPFSGDWDDTEAKLFAITCISNEILKNPEAASHSSTILEHLCCDICSIFPQISSVSSDEQLCILSTSLTYIARHSRLLKRIPHAISPALQLILNSILVNTRLSALAYSRVCRVYGAEFANNRDLLQTTMSTMFKLLELRPINGDALHSTVLQLCGAVSEVFKTHTETIQVIISSFMNTLQSCDGDDLYSQRFSLAGLEACLGNAPHSKSLVNWAYIHSLCIQTTSITVLNDVISMLIAMTRCDTDLGYDFQGFLLQITRTCFAKSSSSSCVKFIGECFTVFDQGLISTMLAYVTDNVLEHFLSFQQIPDVLFELFTIYRNLISCESAISLPQSSDLLALQILETVSDYESLKQVVAFFSESLLSRFESLPIPRLLHALMNGLSLSFPKLLLRPTANCIYLIISRTDASQMLSGFGGWKVSPNKIIPLLLAGAIHGTQSQCVSLILDIGSVSRGLMTSDVFINYEIMQLEWTLHRTSAC